MLIGFGQVGSLRILPETAEVTTKRNGLSEGSCSFEVTGDMRTTVSRAAFLAKLPVLGAVHPFVSFVWMDFRRLLFSPTCIRADCRYSGAEPGNYNVPQYELMIGMEEAPIETHPNFAAIAGIPSAPLNGAIFIDPASGQPGTDDDACVFDRFAPFVDGEPNPKAGIEAFLNPVATYTESYVTSALPSASGFGQRTSSVPGPGFPGSTGARDWLYMGYTYSRRGAPGGGTNVLYEVKNEWRMSGLKGWDEDIYA